MTTITDEKLMYTNLAGNNELQSKLTATIPAINGSRISIDALSCTLSVATTGTTATAWITATVDGVEKEIAKWTEVDTAYQPHSENPAFIVDEGKEVILKWYLRSSSKTVKARMKLPSYSYSYKQVEEPEVLPVYKVEILCESLEDAQALQGDLQAHVGERVMEIYQPVKV